MMPREENIERGMDEYTVEAEERRLERIFTSDAERALHHSTDCLRLAARMLWAYHLDATAQLLTEQADKNIQILLPWTPK
jgi:hypothetical protein